MFQEEKNYMIMPFEERLKLVKGIHKKIRYDNKIENTGKDIDKIIKESIINDKEIFEIYNKNKEIKEGIKTYNVSRHELV